MITITIDTDNANFYPEPAYGTARILRDLADKIEAMPGAFGERIPLHDDNGKTIGLYKFDRNI